MLSFVIVGSFGSSSSSLLLNYLGGHLMVGGRMCLLTLVGLREDSACSFSLGVSAGLRAFPYPPLGLQIPMMVKHGFAGGLLGGWDKLE